MEIMHMNIQITADSTCDLSPQMMEKFGFVTMPLSVTLGDKDCLDSVDCVPSDIYKFVADTKMMPKTAARSPLDYETFFRSFVEQGKKVIHFSISNKLSSSYQNANIAAGEFEGMVEVVDSRNLSTGTALLMLDAYQMIEQGETDIAAIAKAQRAKTGAVRASFVVDTLDYLKMGGRCSALALLGANMLKIHPCIEVADGAMGVGNKYRGPMARVILQYVADKLSATPNIRYENIFITHTSCSDEVVAAVKAKIEETASFKNIYITEAGSTIASHCGAGTLGILFEVNE